MTDNEVAAELAVAVARLVERGARPGQLVGVLLTAAAIESRARGCPGPEAFAAMAAVKYRQVMRVTAEIR